MTNIQDGDICLTKFTPAYRSELRKYRPSVVVRTSPKANLVTIVPISSVPDKKFKSFETLIPKEKATGLEKDSFALAWYIRTIDSARLVKKIGKVDSKTLSDIKKLAVSYIRN